MEAPHEIAHAALSKAVLIWNWEDAPEQFREMSTSGGDEDYVMYVPSGINPFYKLYELSCCSNDVNKQLDGSEIVIGSHA